MADKIKLDELNSAVALRDELQKIRYSIIQYDPRTCSSHIVIELAPGIRTQFPCSLVMETLRPIERSIEGKLHKLGVDYGPSAVNPGEYRKAIFRKVAAEIQSLEGYRQYIEAIRNYGGAVITDFEAKLAINKEDLAVFTDYVRHG